MIQLFQILESGMVLKALLKDDVFKDICGINTLNLAEISMAKAAYYAVFNNKVLVGLVIAEKIYTNTISVHGAVYKEHRQKSSGLWGKKVLQKLKKIYKCALITSVLDLNLRAIRWIEASGFKYKMTIKNGSKQGDLLIYGEQ